MRVEADKLTVATVRRGPFQEYLLLRGETSPGAAGLEVRAAADRYEAPLLSVGQKGEAEVGGNRYALEIAAIEPAGSGAAEVILWPVAGSSEIPETPEAPEITPGQTLHVRLNLGTPSEALLLERGAFFQATGGEWVWRLDEAGEKAARRPVRLGRQNPEVHEVLSGLAPGDRVITSTYDHLEGAEELVLTH